MSGAKTIIDGPSQALPVEEPLLGGRSIAFSTGAGLLALFFLLLGYHKLTTQQAVAEGWVNHTLEVLAMVEQFEGDLAAASAHARGLLIFSDPDTQRMYDTARLKAPADLARLRYLTKDNAGQQATLDELGTLAAQRLGHLEMLVARARLDGRRVIGPTSAERYASNVLVAHIAATVDQLRQAERRLLERRRRIAHNFGVWLWLALLAFSVLSAASFSFATTMQAARGRQRAHIAEQTALNQQLERLTRHLVRARDAADQANRAKSNFIAGMSHELRTPLNGILGYARLLRLEGGLTTTQAMRVDAMLSAGKHLLHMISRVLDLSEIEADRVDLQTAVFNPQIVASDSLELVRPNAEEKGLSIGMSVAAGTPAELVGDPMRLQQVLLNLLGNAVKFTPSGRVDLLLGPSANASALRLEVADTGPGISPDQVPRLFQEFERLETEATRSIEGAGLGLALSMRLASLMGGRLGHADNPGGGSIFWLEMPLDMTVTPAVLLTEDRNAVPLITSALHVLVVDDIFMNRDIASSFLRAAGHKVTCVEGGAQAIEAVSRTDFDVVLMDVRMPEMDGLEATRRIRLQEGGRRRVPILALTAQAFTEQVADCRRAGMDGHLLKPFDTDALLAAVSQAVTTGESHASAKGSAAGAGAAEPPPSPEPNIPAFDRDAFERTAAFLSADKVADYVCGIANGATALLGQLREPDAIARQPEALARAAHTLAGSAGMLGFARVAAQGRQFEQSIDTGGTATPAEARALMAALEATLQAIDNDVLPAMAVPAGAI